MTSHPVATVESLETRDLLSAVAAGAGAPNGPATPARLTVPAIDLNLLGLVKRGDAHTARPSAQDGNGLLLGNVLTTAFASASADGTSPPVSADLLGLVVTTSDIDAQVWAHTGDGQVLGNLLYDVAK